MKKTPKVRFKGQRADNGEWVEGWLIGDTDTYIVSYFMVKTNTKGFKELIGNACDIFRVRPESVEQLPTNQQ